MHKSLNTVSDLDFHKKINRKYQQVKSNSFRFPVMIFFKIPEQVFSLKMKLDVLFRFNLHDHKTMATSSSITDKSGKNLFSRYGSEKLFIHTILNTIWAVLHHRRGSSCSVLHMDPALSCNNICVLKTVPEITKKSQHSRSFPGYSILSGSLHPGIGFIQIIKSGIQTFTGNSTRETGKKYFTTIEQKDVTSEHYASGQEIFPEQTLFNFIYNRTLPEAFYQGTGFIQIRKTGIQTFTGNSTSETENKYFTTTEQKYETSVNYASGHESLPEQRPFNFIFNRTLPEAFYQGTYNGSPGNKTSPEFLHKSTAGKQLQKYYSLIKTPLITMLFKNIKLVDAPSLGTIRNYVLPERKSLLKTSSMNRNYLLGTSSTRLKRPAFDTGLNDFHFNRQPKIEQEVEDLKKTVIKTKEEIEKKLSTHISDEINTEEQYDINTLSDQVYQVIEQRLRMEKELRGL